MSGEARFTTPVNDPFAEQFSPSWAESASTATTEVLTPFSAPKTKVSTGRKLRVRTRKIPPQDLLMITSQLAIMTQTGVDLATALQEIVQQYPPGLVRGTMSKVLRDISEGSSISHALGKQTGAFGESYVAIVIAGESSGKLPQVLKRLAEMLKNQIQLNSMLKGVISYPIVLSVVSCFVLSILFLFVLPQFAKIFSGMNVTPPIMTKVLIDISLSLRTFWYLIPIVLGGTIGGLFWLVKTGKLKQFIDTTLLKNRFIKEPASAILTGRVFRLLGTLVQSGVPLMESVQLVKTSQSNLHFQNLFESLEHRLSQGENVASSLLECQFIPQGVSQMVATAEKSGQIGPVMEQIGSFYEEQGEKKIRDLGRVIEPLIIVAMGSVVALIVASIILPLLDVSTMH